jgi:hypothetical protein
MIATHIDKRPGWKDLRRMLHTRWLKIYGNGRKRRLQVIQAQIAWRCYNTNRRNGHSHPATMRLARKNRPNSHEMRASASVSGSNRGLRQGVRPIDGPTAAAAQS